MLSPPYSHAAQKDRAQLVAGTPMAPTPEGASLGGKGACDILRSLHLAAVENPIDRAVLAAEALEEAGDGGAGAPAGSRKDKSLGLLCDNFIHHFARSDSDLIELEAVAPVLGVGRRRMYDIVNVLESLEIVQKDRAAYRWLGISKLPAALAALERTATTDPIVPLLDDPAAGSAPAANGKENAQQKKAAEKEGRKEKSIRELSVKFVGLFLQASRSKALGGVLSLEHAGRSLLVHQAGVVDNGSLKAKVRRLYDICNVLTSLKMIRKVKLRDTAKPAFEWLGVTPDTRVVFDAETAKARSVRQYGGAAAADAAPVAGAKRAAPGAGGRRVAPKFDTTEVALTRTDTVETVVTLLPLPPAPPTAAAKPAIAFASVAKPALAVVLKAAVPMPTALSAATARAAGKFVPRGQVGSFSFAQLDAAAAGDDSDGGEYEPDEFALAYAAIEDDGGSRGVSPHTEDGDTLRPPFAPASALLSLASLV